MSKSVRQVYVVIVFDDGTQDVTETPDEGLPVNVSINLRTEQEDVPDPDGTLKRRNTGQWSLRVNAEARVPDPSEVN